MTAPVLYTGPRSAEDTAYDLCWEDRQHRAEDWRRNSSVAVNPLALDAETRPVRPGGAR